MRIFGSERMDSMLQKLGLKEGEAIVHPWINKALEKAQQKVEARNFEIRKQLLKFDDVMNDQRKVVYEQRLEFMDSDDVADTVRDMRQQTVDDIVDKHIPPGSYAETWDVAALQNDVQRTLALDLPVADWAKEEGIADAEIKQRLYDAGDVQLEEKSKLYGPELLRMAEKSLLLQILDHLWKEHLLHLEHLRQGIHLRGYGQRDPLNEYKKEAFVLFEAMLGNLRRSVTQMLAHLEFRLAPPQPEPEPPTPPMLARPMPALAAAAAAEGGDGVDPADPSTWSRTARNAPCPCGSGRKFKQCHGRLGA